MSGQYYVNKEETLRFRKFFNKFGTFEVKDRFMEASCEIVGFRIRDSIAGWGGKEYGVDIKVHSIKLNYRHGYSLRRQNQRVRALCFPRVEVFFKLFGFKGSRYSHHINTYKIDRIVY